MKAAVVCLLMLTMLVGCDGLITEESRNFDEWMSCPHAQTETDGDLDWVEFDVTTTKTPIPGDIMTLCMRFRNVYSINGDPDNVSIKESSVLRVFLEDRLADTETLSKIGPEDWFIGEFTIPALEWGEYQMILAEVKIPNTGHFSNNTQGDYTERASFNVLGFLDAQDCVKESSETNNQTKATINGEATRLQVSNPGLANLQIRFLKKTPTLPMLCTGGEVETEWEVLNKGLGPMLNGFDVLIYLGEDLDTCNEMIVEQRITAKVPGSSSIKIKIPIELPYITWRQNGWPLYSFTDKYDPADGDIKLTRELPANGPPGYYFSVYPCIESKSKLIARINSRGTFGMIHETDEDDNCSYYFGVGGNGELESISFPTGGYDVELREFRAENVGNANEYDLSIRYSAEIPFADNCSFGYYWSKNDEAQFGDYFCQRFWCQIQPGHDILLYPFGINFTWAPKPLPPPGTYRMVLMMDDIFKFDEPNEKNNFKISEGTVTVH